MTGSSVAVLCGGVGAARFLDGLLAVTAPDEVTAVVNTGDDLILHGLHISPDLDTITYTLAGQVDPGRGWGLVDETWQAMATLGRYGGVDWFGLGDRDLGTHLYRTQRLSEGATLSEVTAEIARGWDLRLRLLPVTDDPLRTKVTVAGEGEIDFQEYFVHRRHRAAVTAVRFEGADTAEPAPGVIEALRTDGAVVVAPSNPIVSIDPLLAVPGVRDALSDRREHVVAVSPIVGGAALKGPAAELLDGLGHESSVVGVARLYADFAATLVLDEVDADRADEVLSAGMRPVVTDTVMSTPEVRAALATTVIQAAR
jgi:LPPG:FO 2-phospho-L-lactate transferase